MAVNEQDHLNGAYFGPSIPPSESSHRSDRGGCAATCCCCFLNVLWKILLVLAILTGLFFLILYLIFQPRAFHVHVANATLTEFDLANTTTSRPIIHYSLNLNLTVRNPNKKFGFYFEQMKGRVYYEDHRFTAKNVDNFFMEKKSGKNIKLNLKGQSLLLLGATDLKEFDKDKAAGVYRIDLKFQPEIRFNLGKFTFHTNERHPKVNCELKVPLKSSNGSMVPAFKTTKCSVKFRSVIPI